MIIELHTNRNTSVNNILCVSVSSVKLYSFRAAVKFLVKSFKQEGLLSLWRGNTATMARIIPYAAIQYAAHEQWKHILSPTNYR